MNKRHTNVHLARATGPGVGGRSPAVRGLLGHRPVTAPLAVAVLAVLSACGTDTPSAGGAQAGGEPADPSEQAGANPGTTGDPSIDIYAGAPFDDGYLTLDEALVLAATGQTITVPSVGAAEPVTDATDPTGQAPSTTGGDTGPDAAPDGDTGDTGDTGGGSTDGTTGGSAPGSTDSDGTGSSGDSTQTPVAGTPATDEVGDDTAGRTFSATVSDGFTGEVQEDGTVRIKWARDRSARGYNTYRDAEYVDTVFDTEWVDEDTHDGDFYYEIEAFDVADNFTRIATGLTVPVRGSGRSDPTPDTRGTPQIDDYRLIFSEEFEGDSLDLAKWNTSYLWGDDLVINQEEQHYVDITNEPDFGFDPFDVSDGKLTISSVPTPPELSGKANGQPYLSGVITSYDAFKFTYGYAEARAKTPYGKGFWSAFWLLNAFYGDDDPEIDIMEHIGDDQDVVYHTYHYYDGPETLRSTPSMPVPGIDFTGDFHTYAVDWSPGLLVFYVDGRETHRVSDPRVSDQEMYIIANTALGGWWPGSPDATTEFPAEYQIDWIRVYQKSTPYADAPFADGTPSMLAPFDSLPGTSPNHRPPLEMFPNGYPTR